MEERIVRVLVIEDNAGDARLIREMLAEARGTSFQVVEAGRSRSSWSRTTPAMSA